MVRGDETPAEILALAYTMEDSLQTFYKEMHHRTQDQEVEELFRKLVSIEDKHKQTIRELSEEIESLGEPLEPAEAEIGQSIMEGGFDMAEFMVRNEPFLQTVSHVMELAMMLETQALDLYLRFAHRSANAETKEVLFKIAQEEKVHLAMLARLLDEKI